MKTFEDLEFNAHPHSSHFNQHARMDFENGYGISVVNGYSAYCDSDTFEVAVIFEGGITYNTDITDDVLSYQTPDKITEVMKRIQSL